MVDQSVVPNGMADIFTCDSLLFDLAPTGRSNCAANPASVVKCGVLSADNAMKIMFSRHSPAMSRLEVTPREYAYRTTFSSSAGS